ncbi:extracellular solute-binding protein [Paenibacillus mesophilus]|uniref:extracellular solute-binding protein n=1 Tax=Paenibacillus mesophilus TaxID=2582849 RepID=UPI00110DA15C|nr:extracellular solute-binding protein [Paenibacillus mesophilus]TMV46274.1 extracellular solute-binding protein [Paenibacillus mesophilus]
MMMKALLCRCRLACCSLLLASAALSGGCTSTTPAESVVSEDAAGSALPIVPLGSVTLRYAGWDNWYAPASLTLQLPVWQEVEKRTGVKIRWDVSHSSQYPSSMRMKLAAGKEVPDIFALPMDLYSAIEADLIEPLDDWIERYAPNIKRFLADNPAEAGRMRAYDGKLYALSSVTTGSEYLDPFGILIRKDWLDKLGLPEPRTLDEWYTVFKSFKERDPNGNGKRDEIPFMPQTGYHGLALFGNALGLHLFYSRGYYPDGSGHVRAEWLTPEAEKLVVWLNKQYREGLIDPGFMHRTEESIIAGVSRDQIGASMHFLSRLGQLDSLSRKTASANADWLLTLPPLEHGYKPIYEKYGPVSGNFVLSKQSPHKEVATRWLDYIYASEEGNRLMTFGIEGLTYRLVNGQPEYTENVLNNPDGLDPVGVLRSIGAYPPTPWIRSAKGPLSRSPAALLGSNSKAFGLAQRVRSMMVDSQPFAMPTPEELAIGNALMPAIQTYVDESIIAFITGAEPIDWEAFTSKLKELKIDTIVQVKQQQYDRFMRK